MVGFISLLSLIAIIFGGVWSLVANFVENIEKEDIKIIQKMHSRDIHKDCC